MKRDLIIPILSQSGILPRRPRLNPWRHPEEFRVALPDRSKLFFRFLGSLPHIIHWCFLVAVSLLGMTLVVPCLAEETANRSAEEMARRSKIVQSSFQYLRSTALKIHDPLLRKQVLELLDNPAPTFYLKSTTAPGQQKIYEALLHRGFIKPRDDRFPNGNVLAGIFPSVADPRQAPQRFWAAPGSTYEGHHSYPGGLVIHEAFNLRSALSLAANYRTQYPGMKIDEDYVIAAPIWHDAMKAVVFQWREDEGEWPELSIASTGAHHILGIAEALHRKLPPRLVVAIAAAHGAPGFEPFGKMVDSIEAAAILAHVDPVEYGVLKKTSSAGESVPITKLELPWPSFPEATISNLSDGDFALTIPAAHTSIDVLRDIAHLQLMMKDRDLRGQPFNHFRNQVFSQMTQERFYSMWLEGSKPAVMKELRQMGLLPAGEKGK